MPAARPADHRRPSCSSTTRYKSHRHSASPVAAPPSKSLVAPSSSSSSICLSPSCQLSFFTHPIIGSTPHPPCVYKRLRVFACACVTVQRLLLLLLQLPSNYYSCFVFIMFLSFMSPSAPSSDSFYFYHHASFVNDITYLYTYIYFVRQTGKRRWEKPCQSKTSVFSFYETMQQPWLSMTTPPR